MARVPQLSLAASKCPSRFVEVARHVLRQNTAVTSVPRVALAVLNVKSSVSMQIYHGTLRQRLVRTTD